MQWIVSDALKYVTQKTEQVNTLQKLDERIESMEEEEATTTTSGIYQVKCWIQNSSRKMHWE